MLTDWKSGKHEILTMLRMLWSVEWWWTESCHGDRCARIVAHRASAAGSTSERDVPHEACNRSQSRSSSPRDWESWTDTSWSCRSQRPHNIRAACPCRSKSTRRTLRTTLNEWMKQTNKISSMTCQKLSNLPNSMRRWAPWSIFGRYISGGKDYCNREDADRFRTTTTCRPSGRTRPRWRAMSGTTRSKARRVVARVLWWCHCPSPPKTLLTSQLLDSFWLLQVKLCFFWLTFHAPAWSANVGAEIRRKFPV